MVPEWHVSSIRHGYGSPMRFVSLPIISACIHSLHPNAVLRLRFNHFATECSWDHMYVYDGDSVYAPLIAVFSGLIVPEVRGNETVPEVVTTSGYALLHFFSDAAYNLTGFHIFYSMNSCPNNCSGHGKCTTGNSIASRVYCECDKYWKGEACDIPYCKNNCGSPDHGYCDLTGEKLCVCNDSWQGPDCSLSVPSTESYWVLPNVKPFSPSVSRTSHKTVMHGKFMWVIGGYTFNYSSFQMVLKPLQHCQEILVLPMSDHCSIAKRSLLEQWSSPEVWTLSRFVSGTNTWLVPETKGAIVQGGYGHSSVYDGMTKCVYVHGGYKALPANKYGLVDDLYRYEVRTRTWTILKESGLARYLHSAVILSGVVLVFGGNTHNDTALSNGAKCFSSDFIAYDIACDEWKMLPKPSLHRDVNRFGHSAVISNGSMYVFGGFSSVLLNDILVYKLPNCEAFRAEEPCLDAGPGIRCLWDEDRCVSWDPRHTNGTFPSVRCPQKKTSADDRCYRYTDCASCTANTNGCQWCEDKKCISASSNCTVSVKNYTKCHVRNEQICTKLTSCKSCSLNLNCQWDQRQQECHALPAHLCGEGWSHVGDACLRINASRDSYDNAKLYCYNLSGNLASLTTSKEVDFVLDELHKYTVQTCFTAFFSLQKISPWVGLRKINISYWGWEDMSPFTNTTMQWQPGEPNDSGFCAYLEKAEVAGLKANPCTAMADGLICEKPVAQNCSGLRTCSQCLEQPGCGWCNDPSNTGKGQCIEGSSRGPMKGIGKQSQDLVLDQGLCPKDKSFEWAFIHCPACQCNGHSTCVNSSICEQCKNLTTGKQCEACMAGYYGDPTNGGKCQGPFKFHSLGPLILNPDPKPYAMVVNAMDMQIVVIRSQENASALPKESKETNVNYSLLIDYQFTFSLLQDDDKHYTAINFMANPEQPNKNLDMSINASNNFNLNITWSVGSTAGTISGEEIPIVSRSNIKDYRDSFSCEKFSFRNNLNITFYVYVSNFSWPIKIQIAFSQHNSIMDLVQFFVTFFSKVWLKNKVSS
ncbi:Attractin-like protein 1 [Acipenser ruthenus]|uniref:Attractin-like protein 1 n=1 Tax=Acipenser ruthenus TaxID=7906 RepID=A0A444TXU4_ACIRT|nr:Attractin-like protein 1 [Acipenser ruthenus]